MRTLRRLTLHKLIPVFLLDRAALHNHDLFGKFQARAIGKIDHAFDQPAGCPEAQDFQFHFCGRAVLNSFFDEFKILVDIPHLRHSFLGVEILVHQILIPSKQSCPLHEIAAIAH